MGKKIVSIAACLACLFSFSACSLLSDIWERIQSGESMLFGDFIYGYVYDAGDTGLRANGDYVAIVDLTEEGRKKQALFVPDEIDGKPVIKIGNMGGLGYSYSIGSVGNWKWCYLPAYIQSCERFGYDWETSPKRKILMTNCEDLDYLHTISQPIYVSEELFAAYQCEYSNGEANMFVKVANLQFISEGNTCFIADYEEGERIAYIPSPTKRQNHVFDGWYKDAACESEWNFEEDTFLLAEGQTVLKLYAKWTETQGGSSGVGERARGTVQSADPKLIL